MSLIARMTRHPLPFDPELGNEAARRFPAEARELVAGTAGCSPYLAGLMVREAAWIEAALEDPEGARARAFADVAELDEGAFAAGLRQAKRRIALLVALADLAGVWSLEEVTGTLTELGDATVDRALTLHLARLARRGKLPGACEEDVRQTAAGMVVFAMGKLGAGELNYSSDIDLVCLFDDQRFDAAGLDEARAGFVRATRQMCASLSEITGDGYVFRTDLRLRPDPSVTPVCLSMSAAERYYESVGRAWERAAWIKARPAAGDLVAGERFLERLRPFVWRRNLDFAAIQDTHDMRRKIRLAKGFGSGLTLDGHNMKLGAGGIREIEFFTQTRQLVAGGRDESLRVRGTCDGLARLANAGWVSREAAGSLQSAYRAHREVEHRLQMVSDAQTHTLPTTAEGFDRLARFLGHGSTEAFREGLRTRIENVHALAEDFFAPGTPTPEAETSVPEAFAETMSAWPGYPAMRSPRAVELFERVRPRLLSRLNRAAHPEEALAALDGFLAGLPAGVQVFSLLDANPQLVDLLVDIAGTAPRLATYLSRNAGVFDAVIGGDFFGAWPGAAALTGRLGQALDAASDYEAELNAARVWAKEWHFRIGVHHLRGLISAEQAGRAYADLAEAVVAGLWPRVVAAFAEKHGAPPGRGACVLAMGSAGIGQLSAGSDLDLIVIYDPDGVEASDGRRPLASRAYYARLTQALVTALTAPMPEGRLYDVDMRLRPSGRQGPVATSLASFRNYQLEEAWTWEHLALTRARPIAGAKALGEDVEAFRQALLRSHHRSAAQTLTDVAEMRQRVTNAKAPIGPWDAKIGPGRLQDLALLASVAALVAGDPTRDVAAQLSAGTHLGWWDAPVADALFATHSLLWRLQAATRLLTDGVLDPAEIGEGGRAFLLRETDESDLATLSARLHAAASGAAEVIEKLLGPNHEP